MKSAPQGSQFQIPTNLEVKASKELAFQNSPGSGSAHLAFLLVPLFAFFCTISAFSVQAGVLASRSKPIPTPEREWTILVFMNGHNNLDEYTYLDLNEMEKVGSSNEISILVQWASLKNKATGQTPRLLIQKDQDPKQVTSKPVDSIPLADMGSPETLSDFLTWGIQNYPAKKYFVIIWNHGYGWHERRNEVRKTGSFLIQDISHDEISNNVITTKALGEVLRLTAKQIGRAIEIVGMDACLMASIEVAGELEDSTRYLVASEELEPLEGWPYDHFLAPLQNNPSMAPLTLARQVVDSYIETNLPLEDDNGGTTLSVMDLSELPKATAALRNLVPFLEKFDKDLVSEGLKGVMEVSQPFFFNIDYRDLQDFLRRLRAVLNYTDNKLGPPMDEFRKAVAPLVAYNRTTPTYVNARGVSIWLPPTREVFEKYQKDYTDLRFQLNSRWTNLIKMYLYPPEKPKP